jgi:ribosomal peptide maturation radical SAM protein 1
MYRICLINMPFAALECPSLALTQLKAVTEEQFGDKVSVEVCYVNHDFAQYVGPQVYLSASNSPDATITGIGDWLFRQSAFPDQLDNSEKYFKRYYPHNNKNTRDLRTMVANIRNGMEGFFDLITRKYDLDQADLVGFTSMFSQTVSCLALARWIKKNNPSVITVMGGANCESPMGQEIVKNAPAIDFVFSGPALKSFPEFLRYQVTKETNKCHSIQGVFSKRNCALTTLGCGGALGEELPIDVHVKLDYEPFLQAIKTNLPNTKISPALLFETSRGCWWGEKSHCTFCGLNGSSMSYRSMSPEKAIMQFQDLFKYSDRCQHLESVDNILPKNYIKEVLPNIDTPAGVQIFYEVKADLGENDIRVLAGAGVRKIQPGIESLATSTLKLMRKGTTVFINLELLKNCAIYQIYPVWNLLVGFPGEEDEVYRKYLDDLPLLMHLPPPNGVYPVRFDRFSPYYTQAEKYQLDLRPLDYYGMTYPFGKEQLANLAYYFSDSNLASPYLVTMVRWIDKLQSLVQMWQSRWYDKDMRNRPALCYQESGGIPSVFDSRSDISVVHQISELGYYILQNLNKPRQISDIVARVTSDSRLSVESEVKLLLEKGLIFHENGRYLNIVTPQVA